MAWQFKERRSVYSQIVDRLRSDILSGKYRPEEQLPTVRQLALEAGVNPNTMQRALSELEEEQMFETRGTLGRFVTSDIEILEKARKQVKLGIMTDIARQAFDAGITAAELSEFMNDYESKRGKDNE